MSSTKKFLLFLQRLEEIIMVVAFIIMVCTMFGSVLARNVFKAAIPWFDELARITMLYMVLLGAEVGLRDGTQVRVSAITDMLHGKVRKVVDIIAQVILAGFCCLMTVGAVNALRTSIARHVTTTALNWPQAVPYAALLIGFVAASAMQITILVRMFMNFNKSEEEVAK